jgi:hypothetical protein
MNTAGKSVILSYAQRSERSRPAKRSQMRFFDRLRLSQNDNPVGGPVVAYQVRNADV